jgi:hypothetical protein
VQDTESINDLAAALQQPADLSFELPDPEDEEILDSDFQPKSGGDEFYGPSAIERKKVVTDVAQDFSDG